jgi:glycosyltransferase involved in cell wall biosynthesis
LVPLNSVLYAAGVTGIPEAMACSKAIIVSISPGIRDYIEDGVGGYLAPPNDPEALAKAILKLWQSPDLAAAMGIRNRECLQLIEIMAKLAVRGLGANLGHSV